MKAARFIIDGSLHSSKKTLPVINPFSGKPVGDVYRPGPEHIEAAITSAVTNQPAAAKLPAHQRYEILKKAAAEISANHEDFSRTICLEAGKAIRHARSEVTRAINTLTIAAEESKRIAGEMINMDLSAATGRRSGMVKRFPVGPIAGISPFNFPLNLVCHKVGPALAAGNTIIVKPASATPLSALKLGDVFLKAGLPPGLLNVVPAEAALAEQLVTDPRLAMLSFTGSAEVGWNMKTKAGRKKICLELGGNAAVIVEPDADIDYAVKRCIMGSFAYAGQVCISVQRILVHTKIYKTFVTKFTAAAKDLVTGNPEDESVDVGPMINEHALKKAALFVEDAVNNGAKVHCGGRALDTVFLPTVISEADLQSKIWREEAFAPLVTIMPYDLFFDALDLVNDSDFGLQAGVFTEHLENAFAAFSRIETGGVIINDVPTFRVDHMPYGGIKKSGFGREGVKYAIEEMTEPRLLVINHSR